MQTILKNKNLSPADIKKMDYNTLNELCDEIRGLLIDTVSKNGGHLASNLGAVEFTVALHKVFNCPKDQIVWDVGHQCYVHKILTERLDRFDTLRQENGLSGYSRPSESKYDAFVSGHAGISISAAYGLAVAKKLQNDDGYVISVTGDGAFSNGEIYEAMNNAGRSGTKLIVVLNDNGMSISRNEGALARYLTHIRTSRGYFKAKNVVTKALGNVPKIGNNLIRAVSAVKRSIKYKIYDSNIFEDFGFEYLGPVDGHDLETLCEVFERAKSLKKPVFVHIDTKKGVGYEFAENNPTKYHGVSKFNKSKGIGASGESFSNVFGKTLTNLAESNNKICAITAAMCDGTGLNPFAEKFKSEGRFFDTGIAEGHGMTFAAALAAGGMIPVYAVYSTFFQRAYDQLIHDAALEKFHVVLGIDRSGVVGDDGETHQGIFDVAMFKTLPKVTVYSPANYDDLIRTLPMAINDEGIVAVRYPRGKEDELSAQYKTQNLSGDFIGTGNDIIIVTYGRLWGEVLEALELLKDKNLEVSALKITKILPIDKNNIEKLMGYKNILFYEEGIEKGGLGESYCSILIQKGYNGNFKLRGIRNFVPQAVMKNSLINLKLDGKSIYNDIIDIKTDR